ncbi:MAG: hypothetical protein ACREJI_10090, partial [Candidatus Methylomirabilales bacterium]
SSYILDIISYKTFAASEEGLRAATLKTLKRMDITVTEEQATESGRTIVAAAGDRTIEIELDRLTNRTSRMRVVAKRSWFFRDRATAAEIISQTDRTLYDEPMLARKAPPAATAPPRQVTTAASSPGEKVKEAGQAAEPPDKSTWEKIKEGAGSVGSSVKDSFAKLFGSN